MKKLLTTLLYLTLLFTTVTPVFAVTNQTTISNEAKEHILNELSRANIPNAAIAVIQNGETSHILKNSEHDTIFQIGSVAKSFTGFGVLLLEDMGLLSVSDPINQHLPWFEVRYNGELVPHEDITIYTLLQHSSGFTSDQRRFPSLVSELSQDELIRQLTGIELAFYPSEGHVYGNVNYVILGMIIEAVSGQSFDYFMTQNVLHPLGLYNTYTNVGHAYDTGRVIGGHRLGFLSPRPTDSQWSSHTMPSGGIYSSVSDIARWAGIHLGTIEVSEQFARIVQRSHENNHTSPNPFAETDFYAAAGWNVLLRDDIFENGKILHAGSSFGYIAYVGLIPERDMAVVFLSNVRHMNVVQWVFLLWDAVDGEYLNRAGTDPFVIIDIIFAVLTGVGILFIGLFIRLAVKIGKNLRNGEKAKPKLRIRWLVGLIPSIIGLLFFYVIAPMLFAMPLSTIILLSPASINAAIVAVWIIVAYSLFSLLAKVFVNPRAGN